mmetsp:Transcript_62116/g.182116  ORF Transcript_62116/g.182116 Transcript_62116/m.182116 type:complete len:252 (+) Transcript_62116:1006-1761(+)
MYSSHSDASSFQLLPSQFQSLPPPCQLSFPCQLLPCQDQSFQEASPSHSWLGLALALALAFSFRGCRCGTGAAPISGCSPPTRAAEFNRASTDSDMPGIFGIGMSPGFTPSSGLAAFRAGLDVSPRASWAARRICRRASPAFRLATWASGFWALGGFWPCAAAGSALAPMKPPTLLAPPGIPPLKPPPPMGLCSAWPTTPSSFFATHLDINSRLLGARAEKRYAGEDKGSRPKPTKVGGERWNCKQIYEGA